MRRLNLLEVFTVVFTGLILLLVILLYHRFPHGRQLLAGFGMLLILALFISQARWRWRGISIIRVLCDFSPILFIFVIYEMLGWITPYVRPDIDNMLNKIDLAIFGVYPTVWLEKYFYTWTADILSLAYLSYYFIPLILIIVLYLRGKEEEFFLTMTTLLLGYYLCFIAYIFLPALGPRFTLASLQRVPLQGGIIMSSIVNTLNALEGNQRDVFPSGHTQTVLISLWFAFKYRRPLFWVYLPITMALILSTVYLRFHYAIDVIAGVVYAAITVLLGAWLWTLRTGFQRRESRL